MNREIKFRGLDDLTLDWVFGTPVKDSDIKSRTYIVHGCTDGLDKIIVIPNTVGQYTGLKDKNGKEIYEGDIIKNGLGVIYWCELDAMFKVRWHDPVWRSVRTRDGEGIFRNHTITFEIIGNIHETPELLIPEHTGNLTN